MGAMIYGITYAKDEKPLDLPICKVARAKTTYSDLVKIPEDVKSYITEYKKSWTDLCDRKESASLHQAYGMALNLEKNFSPIFDSRSLQKRTLDVEAELKKENAAHDYLQKELPKFIPAFEGSLITYEYFQPLILDFKEFSKNGNAEDKLFFQVLAEMKGDFILPPWLEGTWDYGGCLKFGEYNWILAFEKLNEAKKIKAIEYSKVITEQQKILNKVFEDLFVESPDKKISDICTCKKKVDVKADLEKLLVYLNKEKTHTNLVAKLQKTLAAIKTGQILVKSSDEVSCGGG